MLMHNAYVREWPVFQCFPLSSLIIDFLSSPDTKFSSALTTQMFLCMSPLSDLQWLSISPINSFQSVEHKLNIMSAPASPTTSAQSPSLCPCMSPSFYLVVAVSHPGSRKHKARFLCFYPRRKAVISRNGLSLTFLFVVFLNCVCFFDIYSDVICLHVIPVKTTIWGPEWISKLHAGHQHYLEKQSVFHTEQLCQPIKQNLLQVYAWLRLFIYKNDPWNSHHKFLQS